MLIPLILPIATLAAATVAGYHTMAPSSQLYGRTFIGTPGNGRKLALSYDDGPNDPDTLLLLDVLARHNVKATFFLIGKFVNQRPDIVQRIVAEGHAIGNHTYSHPNLIFCSASRVRRELDDCAKVLADAGCGSVRLFRPPFGGRKPQTLRIARESGYEPVNWTVTCYDWKATTADRVEAHAIRQIRGGDVILMHDGGHKALGADRKHTIEATDRIIRKYKADGFQFVTIPEWIAGP